MYLTFILSNLKETDIGKNEMKNNRPIQKEKEIYGHFLNDFSSHIWYMTSQID